MSDSQNDPNREPAHILWVELTTRISRQSLHARSGQEEAASNSIHKVFTTARDLMVEHHKAKEFCRISEEMLNQAMRPYTSRWHGWMDGEHRFVSALVRKKFRQELKGFSEAIDPYVHQLAKLSGNRVVNRETSNNLAIDRFFANLPVTEPLVDGSPNYREMIEKERGDIRARRRDQNRGERLSNLTGIALSGGGIRSATFCQGIVTELAKRGILDRTDYLSTVSGGGYFGAFITSALTSIKKRSGSQWNSREATKEIFGEVESSSDTLALRHLRNNSQYLISKGFWGFLLIKGMMLFGIILNLLTFVCIGVSLAIVAWVSHLGISCILELAESSKEQVRIGGLVPWMAGALGIWCVVLLPITQSYCRGSAPATECGDGISSSSATQRSKGGVRKRRLLSLVEGGAIILGVIGILLTLIYYLPNLVEGYDNCLDSLGRWTWEQARWFVGAGACLIAVASAIGAVFSGGRKRIFKAFYSLFGLIGILASIWVFFTTCSLLYNGEVSVLSVFLAVVGFCLWGYFCVNINYTSPHRFYRNRLCDCFLVQADIKERKHWSIFRKMMPNFRNGKGVANFYSTSQLSFQDIDPIASPVHLVNCAVNLPYERNPDLRGRKSDFFVFSKRYSGSLASGILATSMFTQKDPHLDLGTAVAISGAAASSQMGHKTPKRLQSFLTVLNIRLGYWIPNPGNLVKRIHPLSWVSKLKYLRFFKPGPWHLIKEMTNWFTDTRGTYLNVSDGGHIENLGIYELLRRRCRFIIAVEGGRDSDSTFAEIRRLQRYAEVDLGYEIEIDLSDISPGETGYSKHHFTLGTIKYSETETGFLLLFRLTMTGDEKDHVADYKRRYANFPHQSTADQVFDETQYEAYRSLGETAATGLLEQVQMQNLEDIEPFRLFQELAKIGLPDNHWLFERVG